MNSEDNWYNLKYEIADFLIPKLTNYKQKFADEGMCIPTWLEEKEFGDGNLSDAEVHDLNQKWISILKEIILAFQLVQDGAVSDSRVTRGLNLFAKYYVHFWD